MSSLFAGPELHPSKTPSQKALWRFGKASPLVFMDLNSLNSLVLVSLTVKCMRNKPAYFAERLYKSMKVKSFGVRLMVPSLSPVESGAWQ